MVFRRDNYASPRTRCRQPVLNHVVRISAAAPHPQVRALATPLYREPMAQKQARLPAQDPIARRALVEQAQTQRQSNAI